MIITRKSAAVEVLMIFATVMVAIWLTPERESSYRLWHSLGCSVILVWIFISWKWREDTLTSVGLLPRNFDTAKPLFCWSAAALMIMLIAALSIDRRFYEKPEFSEKVFRQFRSYLGWAVFQQVVLQGYFTNRLFRWLENKKIAAVAAGLMFGLAHLPNPVLAPATALMGGLLAYYFLQSRNVYIIALIHAILGTAVKYLTAAPLLDNPMRIGPNFFN